MAAVSLQFMHLVSGVDDALWALFQKDIVNNLVG
jgi:hypothetical protein